MCLDIGKWQKRHQQFVQIFTLSADAASGAARTLAHLSPRGHKSNPPSSVRPRLKALKSASCCWVSAQAAIFSATSFSSSNPLLCSLRVGSELVGSKGVYIVKEFLGEGGFGKVAKCSKLWSLEYYAVKIMKISREGQKEFETMKLIQDLDPDENHLIKMYECFTYRKMTCIVYELLEVNFHDSLMNEQQLVPLCYIRVIAQQLLKALKALKSIGVAHCDIKLDNIMFKDLDDMNVKLIDFGLAVETNEILTGTKMQVTQFRAPEVILGLPLDESVDMWALGMVLACVYCGYYLFLSSTEYETIRAMVLCTPEEYTEITGNRVRYMNPVIDFDAMTDKHRNMYEMHDDDDHKAFIDLLKRMLEVNPQRRITPSQALEHDFITMKHLAGKSKAAYAAGCEGVMGKTPPSDAQVNPSAPSSSNSSPSSSAAHLPQL
uniref:Protein kinase domain-containing protein n=1 Tax=Oryzias latipes TaxID=8090 RepID=A0A3B3I1J4_ORYLA